MNIKRAIKSIVAVATVGLIGVSLTGCSVGIDKDMYAQKLNELANAQAQITALQEANNNLVLNNTQLAKELEQQGIEIETYTEMVDNMSKEVEALKEIKQEVETELNMDIEEVEDNLVLGDSIDDMSLDHYDASFLYDGDIEFDDEDYDVKEYIDLMDLKIGISNDDTDFSDTPYVLFESEGSVKYSYVFEDKLPYTDITEDEPLEITFLGKDYEIIDFDNNEFTYKEGVDKEYMNVGDVYTYEGKEVKLNTVTEDKVIVTVDGVTKTIDEQDSKRFGDFEVRVKEILYQDYESGIKTAELEFGKDVLQTVERGDDFEDNDDYVWDFVTTGDELVSISVAYDEKLNDIDEGILAPGDNFEFLDFFKLGFEYDEDYDYIEYELTFDEITNDDFKVVKIKTDDEDIKIGNKRVDTAYTNGTMSWYKEDGDWINSTEKVRLVNDEIELEINYDGTYVSVGNEIELTSSNLEWLGAEEEDAEETDVIISGNAVGKVDEDYLLSNGIVVYTLEDNADDDKLEIKLPNEEVLGRLTISR